MKIVKTLEIKSIGPSFVWNETADDVRYRCVLESDEKTGAMPVAETEVAMALGLEMAKMFGARLGEKVKVTFELSDAF